MTTPTPPPAERAVSEYSRAVAERAAWRDQQTAHPDLDAMLVGWYWPGLPLVCDVLRFHHWERSH